MRKIITDLQKSGQRKVPLTIAINFICSKVSDEEYVMHSKSDNTEFKTFDNQNQVFDELSKTLFSRCQGNLETSLRGSDFVFNSVQLLHEKCHIRNFIHIMILLSE